VIFMFSPGPRDGIAAPISLHRRGWRPGRAAVVAASLPRCLWSAANFVYPLAARGGRLCRGRLPPLGPRWEQGGAALGSSGCGDGGGPAASGQRAGAGWVAPTTRAREPPPAGQPAGRRPPRSSPASRGMPPSLLAGPLHREPNRLQPVQPVGELLVGERDRRVGQGVGEAGPRQRTGECSSTSTRGGRGTPGRTRSYSSPTRPGRACS
jgi:hypothetical protein